MDQDSNNNSDYNGILEEYTKPRRFQSRFWVNIVLVIALVTLVLVFKFTIVDQSVSVDEIKSSVELFNVSSRWVVKKKIDSKDFKGIILAPQFSFQVRNKGEKELKDLFVSGVFKFVEDKKFLGEQVKKFFDKPLPPGQESQLNELTSDFGYQASGVEAFQKNAGKWKTTIVEIYLKTPHSPMFFYKSYYISHRIKGTDIEVKIT
jgi:hypothetical protein